MIYQKIRFKNFLSYGGSWTEFDFQKGINRLSGKNGDGKSCIPEAIYFALFGKTYRRINLPQLVNSINKTELQVELFFESQGQNYKIERGLKPSYLKIYEEKDNKFEIKPLSAHKKDYQELLEQEAINTTDAIFNQINYKSITKNLSFLSLGKNDKRMIIENLFDISIFSRMNRTCKQKNDDLDMKLSNIKKDLDFIILAIKAETENLSKLRSIKQQISEESLKKIENIEFEIQNLNDENDKFRSGFEIIIRHKEKKKSINESIESERLFLKKNRHSYERKTVLITSIETKLQLLESTCKGCTKISEIENDSDIETFRKEKNKLKEEIEDSQKVIKENQELLLKSEKIISNEQQLNTLIKKNEDRIEQLEKSKYNEVNKEIIIDEEKLKSLYSKKEKFESHYDKLSLYKKHLAVVKTLISDDGIKSYIIKKFLPSINRLLNTYLQKFNAGILFYFDHEFNEIVGSRYKEDFSYFSFSEGQKRRIDLAIMFAFLEFATIKNKKSNSNLLILDEISSMLDAEGENGLYDILRDLVNRENKCVLSISNTSNIDPDKIDFLYEIKMEKGFSNIRKVKE